MRLLVSQGEIGVLHPGNAAAVTELVTYGASPCVILGIQKGTTTILAHVHRANALAALQRQLADILADAVPGGAPIRAFLATETYTGSNLAEKSGQQGLMVGLQKILMALGITQSVVHTKFSAAVVNRTKFDLSDDAPVVRMLSASENEQFVKWAMAYDQIFGESADAYPMAIRVGVNAESPEHAMRRLFAKGQRLHH